MKIVFTNHFLKKLEKLWNLNKNDVLNLVKKYPDTKNLILLDSFDDLKILKWYLLSKKIRILVLFEMVKWKFAPVYIWKKESRKWANITKNNYLELFWNDIDKVTSEILEEKSEEIEFEK